MIRIMKMGQVPPEEIFNRNMPTMNVSGTVAEIIAQVRERKRAAAGTEQENLALLDRLGKLNAAESRLAEIQARMAENP